MKDNPAWQTERRSSHSMSLTAPAKTSPRQNKKNGHRLIPQLETIRDNEVTRLKSACAKGWDDCFIGTLGSMSGVKGRGAPLVVGSVATGWCTSQTVAELLRVDPG